MDYIVDSDSGDVMLTADAPITPDVAPPPGVTTSNNWANSVTDAMRSVVAAGGSAISQRILTSSTVQNRPPNSSGRNMQALSTPGGAVQPFSRQMIQQNAGALMVLAIVVVAFIAFVRK